MAESHHHDAEIHDHGHVHVTHYVRPEEDATHLEATHGHEHNHPALSHEHEPHEDAEKEHPREAHIHDHAHPSSSPG
jgi:hypothetical protein